MRQEAIWDYFQNEAPETFAGNDGRQRFLAAQFPSGTKVLNIGVGSGAFERIALARGLDVHSADPSARSITGLRERLGLGEKAQVAYGQSLPFPDAAFQGVVISEVLEHLTEVDGAATLREIHRVLRPGGRLLVTVPANEDLNAQMVVCPGCAERFHRWGHVRAFDAAAIRRMLEPDFQVERLLARAFITWGTLNWKGRLVGLVKEALRMLGAHGSGETFYVCARRR